MTRSLLEWCSCFSDCEFTITVKHVGADTPQQAAAGAGKGAKGGAKAPAAAAGRGVAAPKDASTVIKVGCGVLAPVC
jgi:hypothetical protein